MKISTITPQQNFGRVIKVQYVQPKDAQKGKNTINYGIEELGNVLNCQKSDIYTKKERKKIRNFFKSNISDYEEASGAIFRKIPNFGFVLLTGEDKNYIKKIEKQKKKCVKQNPKVANGIDKKFSQKINKAIMKNLENGAEGKPFSRLDISATEPIFSTKEKFSKIDNFEFTSERTYFSSIKDGYVIPESGITPKRDNTHRAKNIIIEHNKLHLHN